ncbi:MAG TPA: CAP domain-containing protein [Actinomycetes bacterium]|nr:CAP domain-containing protein [Actinomycetes bacterium]
MTPVRPWRKKLATTLVGIVAMSLALIALPGVAHAGPNEGTIFSAVNSARSSAGLRPYAYAGDLAAAARRQAERMAASGELYHNPNLGSEVGGWSRIGENVAFAGDWRGAHQVLMNSPDHRAQILDSGYTQMGVGTAVGKDGTLWVAEVFRTPSGSSAPSTGGSGGGTPGTSNSGSGGGTTTTSSGPAPSTSAPQPTPEQVLRKNLRDAREVLKDRTKARQSNDPIVGALDFTTVMDTLTG